MISQTARIERRCTGCGERAEGAATQAIVRSSLRWDIELRCESCGEHIHTGGPGDTPEEVRQALIQQHGLACARLEGDADQLAILKAVRTIFGSPLAQSKQRATRLQMSGERGTLVEMEFLAMRLRDFGLKVRVDERCE